MNVLVIENHADVLELLSACISARWPQANIIRATEGRDGLHLAQEEAPDLVVLDIGLPDIDGHQVLRQLRVFSHAPVVTLSGHGREGGIAIFVREDTLVNDCIISSGDLADVAGRIELAIRAPGGQTGPWTADEASGQPTRFMLGDRGVERT